MLAVSKILTGAAGLALVAGVATPAAAQYGYGYGYPQSGNVVGQVINQVLGGGAYGQYGQGNSRVAVDQCARAAIARVSGSGYGGYNQGYYNQGYNRGYGYNGYNNAGSARVVAITRVEQRSNGLRVRGVIDTGGYGAYGNQGYGYGNQGYGYGYANNGQQLDFKCTVDYRGYVRDVDLDRRNSYYRGY